jgi:hypothetical protein
MAEWELDHCSTLLTLPSERFVLIPQRRRSAPGAQARGACNGTLIDSLGRVERYSRGHQRVLFALPGVIHEVPDARLCIACEGPQAAERAALAHTLRVRSLRKPIGRGTSPATTPSQDAFRGGRCRTAFAVKSRVVYDDGLVAVVEQSVSRGFIHAQMDAASQATE